VEVARDGQAALERARTGGFDLILLEIMMPRKDGYAVLPRVAPGRKSHADSHVDGEGTGGRKGSGPGTRRR